MANIFEGTPPIWILDTVSATPVTTDSIRIYRIVFEPGTASVAGDECLLKDAAGNTIFDEFSTGADFESIDRTFDTNKGKNFTGLILATLTRGRVFIYLA